MDDSLGTILKLLIYAEGAMVCVWFGPMFLINLVSTVRAIGPAREDEEEQRFLRRQILRTVADAVFCVLAAALVLYIHIKY